MYYTDNSFALYLLYVSILLIIAKLILSQKVPKCVEDDYSTPPYILVVIDMQPKFQASCDSNTLKYVKELIRDAMKDNAYIVIAQYISFGKTQNKIKEMVKKYPLHAYVNACHDDKSKVIHNKLQYNRIRSPIFKICGVNTNACVYRTVIGLINRINLVKIHVIEKACGSSCGEYYHVQGIYWLRQIPNVAIH